MRMLYPGQQRERVDDHESMQNKTLFEVEVSFFQLVADPLVAAPMARSSDAHDTTDVAAYNRKAEIDLLLDRYRLGSAL
jgi:hypothetical protein